MNIESLPLRSLFAISRQMQKSGSPQFNKPPNRAERAISALSRKTGVHRSTIAGKAEAMGKYLSIDALVGPHTGKLVKSAVLRAKDRNTRPRNAMPPAPSVAPTRATGASLRSVSAKATNKALKNMVHGSTNLGLAKHFLRKAEILGTAGEIADRQNPALYRFDKMERDLRGITKSGRSKR